MKLSEAIRLGSLLATQARGANVILKLGVNPFEVKGWDEVAGTCAMGAALHAIAVPWRESGRSRSLRGISSGMAVKVPDVWSNPDVSCSECDDVTEKLPIIIAHLNDYHGKTREEIANWVEMLEQKGLIPEYIIKEESHEAMA